jgi:hypothetical protein
MRKVSIKESCEIKTSDEVAWGIVGPNFLQIADWARGVNKSWKNELTPITIDGAPAGGRFCDLGSFGKADEQIIHFNDSLKEISWGAKISKLPKFVTKLQNNLKVEKLNEKTCLVSSNITAELKGLMGLIMGFYMKKNFTKLIKGFLKDWKAYAETGEVSETKKREIANF